MQLSHTNVDFSFPPKYNGLMKKTAFIFILSLLLISSAFSDNAFLVGFDPVDKAWDNSQLLSFTDNYEKGSELIVVNGEGKSVITIVYGNLPETNEGRDLGLTQAALEELGLWGNGKSEVEVKLRKGSVKEEKNIEENTGWYSFILKGVERPLSYEKYRTLIRKGFKVQATLKDDDLIYFTLPYIVEYEREEKRNLLFSLGLEIEEEIVSENPYIN